MASRLSAGTFHFQIQQVGMASHSVTTWCAMSKMSLRMYGRP
jgi:hypothetical protein